MKQESLFDMDELLAWKEHWKGMPEFKHEDLTPWNSVIIHFEDREAMAALSRILGQTLTEKTQSIWFPKAEIGRMVDKRYRDASGDEPEPVTLEERLPESPTRSKVYSDWANHETWLLTLRMLDDPEYRKPAEDIALAEGDSEDEMRELAEPLLAKLEIDPDTISWAEVVEEFEWTGGMF